jgi:2-polyprenyl-3-methyl-5-hydroxy-6-metoxy-1,4-benzoquinol methylase
LDLTLLARAQEYQEIQASGTELFRSPWVSFAYERGWRQNFRRAGFPGPDEEVKMAQDFLKPTVGGVLLDVSCGSGLFTRRFAQSGDFKAVIALDFSENMLRQTYEFIKQDRSLTTVYAPNCLSPLLAENNHRCKLQN